MSSSISKTSSWTSAKPNTSSGNIFHPDTKMTNEFQGEFEVIPKPDGKTHPISVECSRSNMNYIKSSLPMQHVGMHDIYLEMARKQWSGARPSPASEATPAFLQMKGAKGHGPGGAIGARRDMTGNQVADASRPRMPGGIASDWKAIPELERVNAYVFRGDKRHPRAIKAANGFFPPSTRNDAAYIPLIALRFTKYMKDRYGQQVDQSEIEQYIKGKGKAGRVFTEYEIWREILKGEELHIGRMTVNEFMKGFISTSRSVRTAAGFAQSPAQDGRTDPIVAVYALHSEGGFLLPDAGKHSHAKRSEAEIAHPGPLTWDKVKGFRFMQPRNFDDRRTWVDSSNYVFMRKDFRLQDPQGAYEVLVHLASVL